MTVTFIESFDSYRAPPSIVSTIVPQRSRISFEEARAAGDAMGEKHDCAVIALSVVSGVHYNNIHKMLKELKRRNRCGTPTPMIRAAIVRLQLKAHDITNFYEGSSVRTIVPQLPQQGKFLVNVRKHILAVIDGTAEDWSKYKKLYVQSIWQITDNDEPFPMPQVKRPRLAYTDLMELSPTKMVHEIAYMMLERKGLMKATSLPNQRGWWSSLRAEVVTECVAQGINKTTANVQVGKWQENLGFKMSELPR